MRILLAMLSLALLTAGCNQGGVGASAIKSDDEKVIYALGKNFGDRVKAYDLTSKEQKVLVTGIMDSLNNKEAKAEVANFGMEIAKFADKRSKAIAEKEKEDAKAYLEKMQKEEGAEVLKSGIVYKMVTEGTGATPAETDTVKVNYHGTLRDGVVFDSSTVKLADSPREPEPATFPLNRVIPCWTEAVQKIKVGGKAKITCPSDTAYGDRGAPPKIKPGAPLTFDVELLEIVKETPAATGKKSN
jgi:FKBP-type peptidyl-prolyl cis-trans isomerase FkpA